MKKNPQARVHALDTGVSAKKIVEDRHGETGSRSPADVASSMTSGEVRVRSAGRVQQIIKGAFRPLRVELHVELWGKQIRFAVLDERDNKVLERRALRLGDLVSGPKLINELSRARRELTNKGIQLEDWTLPPPEGGPRHFSRHARPHAP